MYLKISFAGSRHHAPCVAINQAFTDLFNTLVPQGAEGLQFSLLNGLADGTDMACAMAFRDWEAEGVDKTLTAVMPFVQNDYLKTIHDRDTFLELLEACDEVVALDGKYLTDAEVPDGSNIAREARAAAYRAQAQYLLDHCEVLIAAVDDTRPTKAGGTLETVELAKERGLPIHLLDLNTMEWSFIPAQNAQ